MAKRIKFKTQCYKCLNWFEKGKAYLERRAGKWFAHCDDCYNKK